MTPTLVLAAHGTRAEAGERTLSDLAGVVRAARRRHRVELSYLEISRPLLADVLSATPGRAVLGSAACAVPGPVVVVPLLLTGGYHVRVDLPSVIAEHRPDALVAPPLGPHRLLTTALARRLAHAGLRSADAVVLGAAGSSDPAALADVRAAAHQLAVRLSRPVTAAFASGGAPSLDEALERVRPGPATRVAIASYLLAPGFFHDRLVVAGADLVSEPLGADPDVAALVWRRFDETAAALAGRAVSA
ncbi:CbiX/SirB N-terminal domain-containing protein [Nonomuraea sp. NPDC048916]|uniref:sirohydrochlorin chelatase n=1 Tax=Nonomuraea sp. NPDC048916 TaxID=3154232 RepID=UPI0033CF221E